MSASVDVHTGVAAGRPVERNPLPVPFGWFFVAYSEDLKPGELRNVQYFGQEWVQFRTEKGAAGMVDPYCPHLGAHMGCGGTVDGESIRCPFHHWAYDTQGWCTGIPYAKVMPPIVKRGPILRALPTCEQQGIVWAWYHPRGIAPAWQVPLVPELSDPDFIAPRRGAWPVNTFIQELGENGVDFAHLKFLHHAPMIPTGESRPDGVRWHTNIASGMIVIEHIGPGLQVVHFKRGPAETTMVSYPSPITKDSTVMRMSLTHRKYPEGLPEAQLAANMIQEQVGQGAGKEAGFESVDMLVWNNKLYRPRPLLCDGDGQILAWRRYFSQFYAMDGQREVTE